MTKILEIYLAKIGFEPISSDYETDKLPDYSILQVFLNCL